MELLAMYSDGDRSDSPDENSDVGEKDVSPPRVQPSFAPDLQAEWESFEKLISAGHESVKPVHQQHAPLVIENVAGVAEAREATTLNRCVDSDGAMGASEKLTECVPVRVGVGSASGTQSPWSASSNPESDNLTELKKQPYEDMKVLSRSSSKSPETHSCSMSPADDKGAEKTSRRSQSSSPGHSSRSHSGSESAQSRSSSRERSRTRKSRSHSRSRSRSKSRSPLRLARTSRHRRRKHNFRSKSRSHSRNRRFRRSHSPHKKGKHRRRSRSREQFRSKERRRSRSRDRFGRSTRGRDYYKERSSPPPRRKSRSRDRSQDRSRDRSRDRESHRGGNSRDHGRRDHRDGTSGRNKEKPLNFKEQMRQGLLKASKMWTESNGSLSEYIEEKKAEPSTEAPNSLNTAILNNLTAVQNSTVTPQVALLQTMAAMNKKAQEMTGIAVPKYYNPAAVNPLKYAEQVQKRKLLWSRTPKDKEKGPENQWEGTHFSTDQDGKMAAKFRKLMGMKPEEVYGDSQQVPQGPSASASASATATNNSATVGCSGGVGTDDRKKQQEELFTRLDKEYEFARMTTHTHRGVGLGFQSQNFYQH